MRSSIIQVLSFASLASSTYVIFKENVTFDDVQWNLTYATTNLFNATQASTTGQTYTSEGYPNDTSAIWVNDGAEVNISDATIYGASTYTVNLNAGLWGQSGVVLANNDSVLRLSDSYISGIGNAIQAVRGAIIYASNITINMTTGHGFDSPMYSKVYASNCDVTTYGKSSSAYSMEWYGTLLHVEDSVGHTHGERSAVFYADGNITAYRSSGSTEYAPAAVVTMPHNATVVDCDIVAGSGANAAVHLFNPETSRAEANKLYPSLSRRCLYSQKGGSLTLEATNAPVVLAWNADGTVTFENVTITSAGDTLVYPYADSTFGVAGANGADVLMYGINQIFTGAAKSDNISSVILSLSEGSQWTGSAPLSIGNVSVVIEAGSTWIVNGTSYVQTFTVADTSLINSTLVGMGYNVYYNSSANSYLEGETYSLTEGGSLLPFTASSTTSTAGASSSTSSAASGSTSVATVSTSMAASFNIQAGAIISVAGITLLNVVLATLV